jgi:L,D-transpeptidase YbiS
LLQSLLDNLLSDFIFSMRLVVSISQQTLTVFNTQNKVLAHYSISTAANGAGCEKNSGCTPLGKHIIRAKIGEGAPVGSVFVGRRPTGEVCTPALMTEFPNRDWILTRILWLSGTEVSVNRLGNVDTMQRYIYIHGTPDSNVMGVIGSHGCVRMRNADMMALFDMADVGVEVDIQP